MRVKRQRWIFNSSRTWYCQQLFLLKEQQAHIFINHHLLWLVSIFNKSKSAIPLVIFRIPFHAKATKVDNQIVKWVKIKWRYIDKWTRYCNLWKSIIVKEFWLIICIHLTTQTSWGRYRASVRCTGPQTFPRASTAWTQWPWQQTWILPRFYDCPSFNTFNTTI